MKPHTIFHQQMKLLLRFSYFEYVGRGIDIIDIRNSTIDFKSTLGQPVPAVQPP